MARIPVCCRRSEIRCPACVNNPLYLLFPAMSPLLGLRRFVHRGQVRQSPHSKSDTRNAGKCSSGREVGERLLIPSRERQQRLQYPRPASWCYILPPIYPEDRYNLQRVKKFCSCYITACAGLNIGKQAQAAPRAGRDWRRPPLGQAEAGSRKAYEND